MFNKTIAGRRRTLLLIVKYFLFGLSLYRLENWHPALCLQLTDFEWVIPNAFHCLCSLLGRTVCGVLMCRHGAVGRCGSDKNGVDGQAASKNKIIPPRKALHPCISVQCVQYTLGPTGNPTQPGYCKTTSFRMQLIFVNSNYSWFITTNFCKLRPAINQIMYEKPLVKINFRKFAHFTKFTTISRERKFVHVL